MPRESEKQTRKKRIDQHLKDAGWFILPYSEGLDHQTITRHAIEEF